MQSSEKPPYPADPNEQVSDGLEPSALGVARGVGKPGVESTRVDKWLCATRLFKSRSQAQAACEAGRVCIGDAPAKASRVVSVGDTVTIRAHRGPVVVVVRAIEEKRQSPTRARLLYEDRSPPPLEEGVGIAVRPRGAGRPTKAERRAIARLTGDDSER